MWQISFILVPIVICALLPQIIISSFTEKVKIKERKLICKWPKAYRIVSFIGVLLFSFLLIMFCLTTDEWNLIIIILYVFLIVFLILSTIFCYICFRNKIVINVERQEILVYRLIAPKKRVAFTSIYYEDKSKKEIFIVKDSDKKKLFSYVIFLTGTAEVTNCLKIIIENNQNHEPIDTEKINVLFQRSLTLKLK